MKLKGKALTFYFIIFKCKNNLCIFISRGEEISSGVKDGQDIQLMAGESPQGQ